MSVPWPALLSSFPGGLNSGGCLATLGHRALLAAAVTLIAAGAAVAVADPTAGEPFIRATLEPGGGHMEPPDPSPWPILVLSVVGWTLLGLAMMASGHWSRGLLVAGVLASALATAVLFYDYEREMSPYTTIRLDVFLVWPMAGSALALPGAVWWLIYRRKRGGTARG